MHERVNELDDELLLAPGQDSGLLESALEFSNGSGAAWGSNVRRAEQVFYSNTEGFCELRKDVGARGLGRGFPEPDAGLRHSECSGKLGLAKPSSLAECGKASALSRTGLGDGATHTWSVRAGFHEGGLTVENELAQ